MNTAKAVMKVTLEKKNPGLCMNWTHDLYNTNAVLYQLS